MTNEGMGSGM